MNEAARELVRDWLTRASHDLQTARTLAATAEPLLDTAIFDEALKHAQDIYGFV
jgi:hypothetical protein